MNSIRFYRLKCGLSRPEAAEKIGVSTVTLWRYEIGMKKPNSERLKAMSAIFNCTVDDLLKETE